MCGIAGVAGRAPDRELLRRMGSALRHRGPDYGEEMAGEGVGLAFRRLSIIDVAGGRQPIWNEDGSVALVLNGEIYNHRELRSGLERRRHSFSTNSDVEVVLHLWEEMGAECIQPLRGMFALAIWDAGLGTLFLARDRIGKKPLYYHHAPDGSLVFASEIKAILQDRAVARLPDHRAIDQFLTLGYVPSGMSAFTGIERLRPGHWLRWRAGKADVRRYWQLEFAQKITASAPEIHEEVARLVREAVSIRLESEVPLGAFLSGGVDSSGVVAFAAQASSQPLNTFSISFEAARFDESAYARLVAETFGTNHHELVVDQAAPDVVEDIVWYHDQPFGDSSAIPTFQLARLTRPYVTVVLTGDGGDESFAGYRRYQLSRLGAYFGAPARLRSLLAAGADPVTRAFRRGRRLVPLLAGDEVDAYFELLAHLTAGAKSALYSPEFSQQVAGAGYGPLELMRSRPHQHSLDAFQDADINCYLPDDLLVKMDVATMASSLEARSPLLDHRLVEFLATVPADQKVVGGESKFLLKSVLRSILPQRILDRRKMGFGVPLGQWLRTGLRERLTDTVLAPRAMQRGYFQRRQVEAMVRDLVAGDNLYQYVLWDLLMLELWHQVYVDPVYPRSPGSEPSLEVAVARRTQVLEPRAAAAPAVERAAGDDVKTHDGSPITGR